MYNKYKSNVVSIIAAFVFAAAVIAAAVMLPLFVKLYLGDGYENMTAVKTALFICLYGAAVPSLLISYLLLRILFNVRKNVVFDRVNVKYCRYISWCCFAVCAFFFALGFFIPFSFVIAFAAGFIGLVVRVVKNLFNEAVDIKEENDLTV
jgi:hypothetical protein